MRLLSFAIILLLTPCIVFSGQGYCLASSKVIVNGNQLVCDQEPIIINDRILAPIRPIVEALGAIIEWKEPNVVITKGSIEIFLTVNSTTAIKNKKIFFMEQPPIIINGRTLVSLRFISEALGANVTWNDNNRIVTIISDGDFEGSKDPIEEDSCYKYYDLLVGPDTGPTYEEAQKYVLEQHLLYKIGEIQYAYTRFVEYGSYNTMIIGNDEEDNRKVVW